MQRLRTSWQAARAAWAQARRLPDAAAEFPAALPAAVVILDAQERYRFVNSVFAQGVGQQASEIVGRTAAEVLGVAEAARRRPCLRQAIAGESVACTLSDPTRANTTTLWLNCIPLTLGNGTGGLIVISQDITLQCREQQRLVTLAERDPLTGLLNRAGLQRCADGAPAGRQALLYIDLDRFKAVNDHFGHTTGDRLLVLFARRLIAAVRRADAVARLGGDEFAVLLHDVRAPQAAEVADQVLRAASEPFSIAGRRIAVGASVGVALHDGGLCKLPLLMAAADALLYQAKAAGRGQYRL